MHLIKLDATNSTNTYLKQLQQEEALDDFTVVHAAHQYEGRGQMGSTWLTEAGKNLTFSILKKHVSLPARNGFEITMAVSVGIYSALKELLVPELSIKWPNDILSGTQKICGILIENMTAGGFIQSSVIGIGLNVNQLDFSHLTQVSSLQLLLGRAFNIDETRDLLLRQLQFTFKSLGEGSSTVLRDTYEPLLFRKDKPSTFRGKDNQLFMGFIRGVSTAGRLIIALEDDKLSEFDLKEVQLLY